MNCRFNILISHRKFNSDNSNDTSFINDKNNIQDDINNEINNDNAANATANAICNENILKQKHFCDKDTSSSSSSLLNRLILYFVNNYNYFNEYAILNNRIQNLSFNDIKKYILLSYSSNNDTSSSNSTTTTTTSTTINNEEHTFYCTGIYFKLTIDQLRTFLKNWSINDIGRLITTVDLLNEHYKIPKNYSQYTDINEFTLIITIKLSLELITIDTNSKIDITTTETKNTTATSTATSKSNINNIIENEIEIEDSLFNLFMNSYEISIIYPSNVLSKKTITSTNTGMKSTPPIKLMKDIHKISNYNSFRKELIRLMS